MTRLGSLALVPIALVPIALVSLALGGTLASCRAVLGLGDGDYQAAVEALCSCDPKELPSFGAEGCLVVLDARLRSATADTRAAWLQNFDSQGCADDCSAAYDCYQMTGSCAPQGSACTALWSCCGQNKDAATLVCEADGRCP
jgi:hypothetical protein